MCSDKESHSKKCTWERGVEGRSLRCDLRMFDCTKEVCEMIVLHVVLAKYLLLPEWFSKYHTNDLRSSTLFNCTVSALLTNWEVLGVVIYFHFPSQSPRSTKRMSSFGVVNRGVRNRLRATFSQKPSLATEIPATCNEKAQRRRYPKKSYMDNSEKKIGKFLSGKLGM